METIIWGLVSLIISFVISSVIFGFKIKKEEAGKKTGVTLLGLILGLMLHFSFYSFKESKRLSGVEKKLNDIEIATKMLTLDYSCINAESNNHNESFKNVANLFLDQSQIRCEEIRKGEIILYPYEVKKIWETLVKNAKESLYATNTIAPSDWPDEQCELQLNCNASIHRIMIHRKNDTIFNNKLKKLGTRQLEECNVKSVQWIYKEELYEPEGHYFKFINALQHIDLVLVDNEILLLTNYDEQEKRIINGVITNDPTKIKLAKNLFKLLTKKANNY